MIANSLLSQHGKPVLDREGYYKVFLAGYGLFRYTLDSRGTHHFPEGIERGTAWGWVPETDGHIHFLISDLHLQEAA